MKKFNQLLILCILTLVNVSCDGDEEPEQNLEQPGALVVTVEGESIDNETIDFFYQTRAAIGECNDTPCMIIEGRNGAEGNKEISINIDNLTSAGTYVIGGTSDNYGSYSISSPTGGGVTIYGSSVEEGSLTVTSYEGNKIKGNFSFPAVNGKDMISISGTFDLIVSE